MLTGAAQHHPKGPAMTGPRVGWRHIAADIEARIEDGTYLLGSQLPSLTQLAAHYGATLKSVQYALIYLEGRGVVRPKQGVGVFVVDPAMPVSPPPTPGAPPPA